MFVHSTNQKGAIAEAAIALEAIKLGIPVLRPAAEHGRYDLALDLGRRIIRVQVKWASVREDVIKIAISGCRHSPVRGYVRSTYAPEEVDAVAAYAAEIGRSYLLPIELLAGQSTLHLRLAPPQNHQRAALHWAADHEFQGAVAQLAERCHGMAEAGGSNPPSSTPPEPAVLTVGAHEFHRRFGYYMERATAGEEITVTRRGKPTVRLVAHQPEMRVKETSR